MDQNAESSVNLKGWFLLQYENEVKIGFWTKKALTRPGFSNASGEVCPFAFAVYIPHSLPACIQSP